MPTLPDASYDRTEALSFLGALVEDIRTPLSWRVFDDTKRTRLALSFYGAFDEVLPQLLDAQKAHCGVFVVVNVTAERGTTDESVVGIRAAFVDGDGKPMPTTWALPPTVIVARDPTHWHAYWLFEEGEPVHRFREVQRRLATFYGTDLTIINESRVMRMPGFWHLKDPTKPQMYRVKHHAPAKSYTVAQIIDAHPASDDYEASPSILPRTAEIIEPGGRHQALLSLSGWLRRHGRTESQILALLREFNREQCHPPKPDSELVVLARDMVKHEPDQASTAMVEGLPERTILRGPAPTPNIEDLIAEHHGTLRPSLVEGFVRETEVANLVAPPKSRKSWLVADLALSVATGTTWLGKTCEAGHVLLVDNELHQETLAKRFRDIAGARGLVPEDYVGRLFVWCARGSNTDLVRIEAEIVRRAKESAAKLIILDALYRFLPEGAEENSNSDGIRVFNLLDRIAKSTGAAIVNVHHTSKGNQAGKSITDLGAGAGSWSRAADTHAALRQLEDEGCAAFDAACRSWSPKPPIGLRWEFPRWHVDPDVDVSSEKGGPEKRERRKRSVDVTPDDFASHYVGPEARAVSEIMLAAVGDGLSENASKRLIEVCHRRGIIHMHQRGGGAGRPTTYATTPPTHDVSPAALVMAYLRDHPEATSAEVAEATGVSKRTVERVRNA